MPDNSQNDRDKDSQPPAEPITQEIQHHPVSARVPEEVGRGVFCTSTSVLHTNQEFLIDFLSTMVQPHQIVARIVMTPLTFSRLLAALQENLKKYQQQFDKTSVEPQPTTQNAPQKSPQATEASTPAEKQATGPNESPPAASSAGQASNVGSQSPSPAENTPNAPSQVSNSAVADFYERIKLPDEMLAGVYANVVMIGHSKEEFSFDFITNFYPRSVVTCRIFMSAGRIPAMLQTFSNSYAKFQQKRTGDGSQ